MGLLAKTDKIRFALYGIWKQIDIIGYLNGSTSSKFVSASFKSHLALFSLRTESDNPDATCELSP